MIENKKTWNYPKIFSCWIFPTFITFEKIMYSSWGMLEYCWCSIQYIQLKVYFTCTSTCRQSKEDNSGESYNSTFKHLHNVSCKLFNFAWTIILLNIHQCLENYVVIFSTLHINQNWSAQCPYTKTPEKKWKRDRRNRFWQMERRLLFSQNSS